MTNKKISALSSASTPLTGSEIVPINQSSVTDSVSVANLTAGRSVSASDYVMSTGNLVPSTAAKGINFTANTPAAGMTSQLLNWYEEGTWTPIVTAYSGTITTVGAVSGTYTKIGRIVTVNYSAAIVANGTGTVAVVLSSVPFTPGKNSFGMGKETQATGAANICFVNSGTAQILIQSFLATYPANNGTTLEGQITFTV